MIRRIVLAAVAAAVFSLPALADGVAAGGEQVFKKCGACHEIGEGAKNKVGPNLTGVVGRTAGTAPDFKYSKAMQEAGEGGLVWSNETLEKYLASPKDFVPHNKMAFAGLKKEDDIENVIAYLDTFSSK